MRRLQRLWQCLKIRRGGHNKNKGGEGIVDK
jgi:hypothetical protein